MKSVKFYGCVSALCLGVLGATAQSNDSVEQIRKQLQEVQENFSRMQDEHQRQIELLKQRINELESRKSDSDVAGEASVPIETSTMSESTVEPGVWSPADPIQIQKGNVYADLGVVGTFAVGGSTADEIEGGTQLGGHDPNQNGFTVQGVELNLRGAVDPYFRGNVNVLFSLDSGGETFVELEEAWLESVSLPGNLQVRGGQMLTEFGRLNIQHPHQWGFIDAPLASARFLGPDGLRNPGARLSWLMPTPFFSEVFLTVQDSQGETASSFRSEGGHTHGDEEEEELPFAYRHADNDRGVEGIEDMLLTPRWAVSFDLTDSQSVVLGASGAFGPNSSGSGGDTMTQIYGADVYWKWTSPRHHRGFPFVSFQAEGMIRRYEAGAFDWADEDSGGVFPDEGILVDSTGAAATLRSEWLTDHGFYTQLLYGFTPGWVAGVRYDYVGSQRGDYERAGYLVADGAGGGEAVGRDPFRSSRWRVSPNLTWYPSEFSKIRLQYNYDHRNDFGNDHSVWLQFEFILGAHAAHTF